ncbi:MAG: deoxyribose-phosphate aldolase [Candidatus Paceibacterota bacterium]
MVSGQEDSKKFNNNDSFEIDNNVLSNDITELNSENKSFFVNSSIETHRLRLLMSMLDVTDLDASTTDLVITSLCNKVKESGKVSYPAAVCLYPSNVIYAKIALAGTPVKVVTVAGAFPSGMQSVDVLKYECISAEKLGADEIDIVLNRGAFFSGREQDVLEALKEEVNSVNVPVKVIIESGELLTSDNIVKASKLAIEAGAAFIKTSTGKSEVGATPESVRVICEVIKNHYRLTGRKVGIKISGGVKTVEQADHYLAIVEDVLGHHWCNPSLLRFGASALFDDLFKVLYTLNNL